MKRDHFIHIVSWLAYAMMIFYFQSRVFEVGDAVIHTLRLLGIHMTVFYFHLVVLLPRFFEKNKYLYYVIGIIIVIIGVHYLITFTNDLLPRPDFSGISDHRPRRGSGLRPFLWLIFGSVVNSILMLFFSTIVWMTTESRKRKQRESNLMNEKLQSEMQFLKSQINPHFLFNALNNIYSLSYTKSPQAPQMILKLSEMLRHVVYESPEKKIPLEKELTYIQNYIDFQRLRAGKEINVNFDVKNVDQALMIEPMLLIPFVENAFKHSDFENDPSGKIEILIRTSGKEIEFEITNTIGKNQTKDLQSGIGIENVKRRLELGLKNQKECQAQIF